MYVCINIDIYNIITGFFISANIGFSVSTNPFTFVGPIVHLPSSDLLLLIKLDITKPFYIRKSVTSADNIIVIKILKSTI